MNYVHSEELKVTVTGNFITHHDVLPEHVMFVIGDKTQAGIVRYGDKYAISFPMDEREHRMYAGLIHRLNSENKLKEKVDSGGKGPDNDGPKPTNPRGSGGKVVELENTYAIAA